MTTLVNCNGVAKRYMRGNQPVDVLTAVDLQIRAGDFIALMGPSGSGKTTLLNLLGGLDRPTRGTIEVSGQMLNTMTSAGARAVARRERRLHLPVLQPAAGAERATQRRTAAAADAPDARAAAEECRDRAADRRPRRARQTQTRRAVGRPAATRCDRARDRRRSEAAAVRRTDRRPRSRDRRRDPRSAADAQPRTRQDHRDGDARSEGRRIRAHGAAHGQRSAGRCDASRASRHDAVGLAVRQPVPASHAHHAHAAVADGRVPAVHAAARHCGGVCRRRDGGRHGSVDRRREVLDERQPAAGIGRAGPRDRRRRRRRADELVRRVLPGSEERLRAIRRRPRSVSSTSIAN